MRARAAYLDVDPDLQLVHFDEGPEPSVRDGVDERIGVPGQPVPVDASVRVPIAPLDFLANLLRHLLAPLRRDPRPILEVREVLLGRPKLRRVRVVQERGAVEQHPVARTQHPTVAHPLEAPDAVAEEHRRDRGRALLRVERHDAHDVDAQAAERRAKLLHVGDR